MATVSRQVSRRNSRKNPAKANPYQSPTVVQQKHNSEPGQLDVPALHSVRAIGLTTFLGGVIAGAFLIARNHALQGRKSTGALFLLGAIVWQALLLGVAFSLPFEFPGGLGFLVGMAHALAFQQIAKISFAEHIQMIADGRGQWASWHYPVAAATITMGVMVGVLVTLATLFG